LAFPVALWVGASACGPNEYLVRDQFGAQRACPQDVVKIARDTAATDTQGRPVPGYADVYVAGCGSLGRYLCQDADHARAACVERVLDAIEATDGSVRTTLSDDPQAPRVRDASAIASAAHDAHCAAGEVRVVAHDGDLSVVEGCGQRLTYREEPMDLRPPDDFVVNGKLEGMHDVLVERAAVAPVAPPPAASAPPVPPTPAPAPT
jgi:hypothetical protein